MAYITKRASDAHGAGAYRERLTRCIVIAIEYCIVYNQRCKADGSFVYKI
jgi:hypothetical protein